MWAELRCTIWMVAHKPEYEIKVAVIVPSIPAALPNLMAASNMTKRKISGTSAFEGLLFEINAAIDAYQHTKRSQQSTKATGGDERFLETSQVKANECWFWSALQSRSQG